MELSQNKRLGPFEVLSKLGEGGMGTVYQAKDHKLGRDVAIKVLREEVASDPSRLERFKREARAASSLNHPNIVTIHEIGAEGPVHYLVMELMQGPTLRQIVSGGPLALDDLLRLGTQVADGLAKAHEAGIVHRDLKPENLMVTEDGLIKILDFGLAKLVSFSRIDTMAPTMEDRITRPGMILGTAFYMSPEQAAGKSVDSRSDQFAFGAILYEMATGKRPFERASTVQTLAAVIESEPESLKGQDLPEELVDIIERLLSKAPTDRFASTRDLAEDLRALQNRSIHLTLGPGKTSAGSAPLLRALIPTFLKATTDETEETKGSLFVGREPEIAKLNTVLEKIVKGSGQLVFLTGEPGSGKTALLQEFTRRAQDEHDDLVVAFGNCNAQTGMRDPYLPFRALLHMLTGDVEARRSAHAMSRDQALRLWHLLPDAVSTFLEQSPDLLETLVPGDGLIERARQYGCRSEDQRRLRELVELKTSAVAEASGLQQSILFEQCAKFLQQLARHRPLLLVLEDLHWADSGTVSLLPYLCQHIDGSPIMILGSYRPEDPLPGEDGEKHPLESCRNQLRRKFGDFEIKMGEAQSRSFVDALIDAEPNQLDEEFRQALYRQTQGHPLFAIELLRDLQDQGAMVRDDKGRYQISKKLDWNTLPVRVEAVIAERIGRLPEPLQKILTVASIEGEDFTAEVVAQVDGTNEREVVRLLSGELDKRHHLVRALDVRRLEDRRLSVYRFRHILFQKYLYQSLDAVERSYLHEEVGNALESLLAGKADESAVQLARHFQEAGIETKALHYLARSGDRARQAHAGQEAIGFYTQAIEVSRRVTTDGDKEHLLRAYEGLGLVHMQLTQFDDAIADFHEMRRMAKAAGNQQKEGEALCHLAYMHFLKMSEDQAPLIERYALEAQKLSEKTGDQKTLGRSLTNLGIVHQSRGNLLKADKKLEASLKISRSGGDKYATAQNLLQLAHQAYWQGNYERAVKLGEEGMAVSREIHDGFSELFNLAVVCLGRWWAGDYTDALDLLHEGRRKAKERENRFFYGRLTCTLGSFYVDFGDLSRAVESHQESVEVARSNKVFNVEISAGIDLGHDYLALGQPERALTTFEPTLERVEREAIGSHRWRWTVRLLLGLAEVHYTTGAFEEASRFVEMGLKKAVETSSRKYVARGWALRGRIAVELGDTHTAEMELQRAANLAEDLRSPTIFYPIAHELAQWYERVGKKPEAEELYGKAKAAVEQMTDSIEDEALRSTFLQSKRVQTIRQR